MDSISIWTQTNDFASTAANIGILLALAALVAASIGMFIYVSRHASRQIKAITPQIIKKAFSLFDEVDDPAIQKLSKALGVDPQELVGITTPVIKAMCAMMDITLRVPDSK